MDYEDDVVRDIPKSAYLCKRCRHGHVPKCRYESSEGLCTRCINGLRKEIPHDYCPHCNSIALYRRKEKCECGHGFHILKCGGCQVRDARYAGLQKYLAPGPAITRLSITHPDPRFFVLKIVADTGASFFEAESNARYLPYVEQMWHAYNYQYPSLRVQIGNRECHSREGEIHRLFYANGYQYTCTYMTHKLRNIRVDVAIRLYPRSAYFEGLIINPRRLSRGPNAFDLIPLDVRSHLIRAYVAHKELL